jgi:hypothetical protein
MTARSGLALAGWRPRRDDMAAQAVEWWNWGMALHLHSETDGALGSPWGISPSPPEAIWARPH